MLINLRNALMAGKRLPYDAEVEYLQSSGTQWIDTGINADSNLGFALTFALTQTSLDQRFGAILKSGSIIIRHHFNLADGRLSYYLVNNEQTNTKVNSTTDIQNWAYNSTTKIFSINGVNGAASSTNAFDCNLNYWLFIRNSNDVSLQTPAMMRLFAAKFYVSGALVRDYIPVRVGTVGYLYDRVTGKLFGNAGTGAFTYGNDLKYPIPAS